MEQALLITNLAARSVSQRVKDVIVKALSADLKLDVADTTARHHATELSREAAANGFDLVISFGGDGTMNEVANGLVGTDTALAVLPGGMANVLCRLLGVPTDIVEATGYLMNRVKEAETKKINIGRMDGRYFVMSCGIGLDAATVRRVEANPDAKRRWRDWFFISSALSTAFTEYRGKQPYIRLSTDGFEEDVVLAVACNTPEFTFFKKWPVRLAPKATIEKGLDILAMPRFPMWYIPSLATGLLKTGGHVDSKRVRYISDVESAKLVSAGPPFPIQVDGEYAGERTELTIEMIRDGLLILN